MKAKVKKTTAKAPPVWLVNIIWVAGFIAFWDVVALIFMISGSAGTKFPFVHDLIKWAFSGAYDGKQIWTAIGVTLSVFGKGVLIGFIIGFVFAILMNAIAPIEKVGYPLLLLSQMIPMLGLAPIIVSMVGNFSEAKLVMSAYMTFFPVAANMFAGLKAVDSQRRELMVMCSADMAQEYTKLLIPASLSSMFIGLKLAVPSAFAAVIFTEVLYPQEGGIGGQILNTQYGNDWELCWGYIFAAVLIAIILFYVVSYLEKLVIRWKNSD